MFTVAFLAQFFSNKNNTDTFFAELDGCDVAVSCATVAPWLHLFQQPSVHSVTGECREANYKSQSEGKISITTAT